MLKQLLQALLRGSGASEPAGADAGAPAERLRLGIARAAERSAAGDHAAAAERYRECVELQPLDSRLWCNYGAELAATGQAAEAEHAYRRALALDPALAQAWYNLGQLQQERGSVSEAEGCYRSALALLDAVRDRELWRLCYSNWGLLLQDQGRLQDAARLYRAALEVAPAESGLHSNLLFLLSLDELLAPQQVAAEYRRWGELHADPLSATAAAHANSPEPDRLLRVGYVSADFRRHAMACLAEPFLAHHDRRALRVYCYSNCARPDEVTRQLRALADEWRDIAALSDEEAARLVRADGIDLLIDLSGHTGGHRLLLFARRPAPIQITWLGYLGGSGMAAMDLRITDAHIDPVGVAEPLYRERLVRLPHGIGCYQPPREAPAVNALPALQRGHVTFGSFNNFAKLTDATKHAWTRLLSRLPGARLRVVGAPSAEACDRLLEIFEREGVYADRIDVLKRLPYRAFLEQYMQADIALDPFPYNGGTTTQECLWMGVPVITLAGRAGFSRCGASHLINVGLDELIANSWDEYIDIAVRLAQDLPRLAQLRAGLRQRMRNSALLDAPGFTAALEALYRDAWRQWCSRQGEPHA